MAKISRIKTLASKISDWAGYIVAISAAIPIVLGIYNRLDRVFEAFNNNADSLQVIRAEQIELKADLEAFESAVLDSIAAISDKLGEVNGSVSAVERSYTKYMRNTLSPQECFDYMEGITWEPKKKELTASLPQKQTQ